MKHVLFHISIFNVTKLDGFSGNLDLFATEDEEVMEKGSKNPDHLPSQVKCTGRVKELGSDERLD